jgi:tRNA (Thr-GGU) A37 N-methylase
LMKGARKYIEFRQGYERKLIERGGNKLKVKGLDALEGTPLIDIKSYLSEIDSKTNVRVGWVKETDFSKVYGKSFKESKHVQ